MIYHRSENDGSLLCLGLDESYHGTYDFQSSHTTNRSGELCFFVGYGIFCNRLPISYTHYNALKVQHNRLLSQICRCLKTQLEKVMHHRDRVSLQGLCAGLGEFSVEFPTGTRLRESASACSLPGLYAML